MLIKAASTASPEILSFCGATVAAAAAAQPKPPPSPPSLLMVPLVMPASMPPPRPPPPCRRSPPPPSPVHSCHPVAVASAAHLDTAAALALAALALTFAIRLPRGSELRDQMIGLAGLLLGLLWQAPPFTLWPSCGAYPTLARLPSLVLWRPLTPLARRLLHVEHCLGAHTTAPHTLADI